MDNFLELGGNYGGDTTNDTGDVAHRTSTVFSTPMHRARDELQAVGMRKYCCRVCWGGGASPGACVRNGGGWPAA